ncbi:MAG: hypothetical protein IJU66_05620 [Oscillospiraceae bacterium]|nr:hypothetical protein [Oscillospiraceae bacterium]
MSGLESDTVGGYNAMLEKQRRQDGECWVSTVLFNTETSVLHDRVPIASVSPMTANDYEPGGCTALLDAVGDSIRHIANIHKYARREDVPAHTIFVITTDGLENASRRYTSDQVKQMIEHEKKKYGWEFIFLAANIDAVETAARIGIPRSRAANYCADKAGTGVLYDAMSDAVSALRCDAPLAANWSAKLEKDAKRARR